MWSINNKMCKYFIYMKDILIYAGILLAYIFCGCGDKNHNPYIILDHYVTKCGLNKLQEKKLDYYIKGVRILEQFNDTAQVQLWYAYDGRYRRKTMSLDEVVIEGDNGTYEWALFDDSLVIYKDSVDVLSREFKLKMESLQYLNRESDYFNVSYLGTISIDRIDCYIIDIARKTPNLHEIYYIDTSTYMLVKEVNITGGDTVESIYDDYSYINGVIYPKRASSIMLPQGISVIVSMDTIIVGIEIDDKMFEPPKETTTGKHDIL